MGKYSKSNRRINIVDIQHQLYDFDDEQSYDDDLSLASSSDYMDDTNYNHHLTLCNLNDLIVAGSESSTQQPSKTRLEKSCNMPTPSTTELETEIVTNAKYQQEEDLQVANICDDAIDEDRTNFMSDLVNKCPWVHFSRLGSSLRASTKILSAEKVAFLLIWNVNGLGHSVQIVPIINCSTLNNSSLRNVCETVTKSVRLQCKEHMASTFGVSVADDELQIFNDLTKLIIDLKNHIASELSRHLQQLSITQQNLSASLEKSLKKSTNVSLVHSIDYYDLFASTYEDCDQLIKKDTKFCSIGEEFCTICFEPCDESAAVHLRTCCHTFCNSCWRNHVRALSNSGNTAIRCPAFKCKEILNIRDIAHILFDNMEEIQSNDMIVLLNAMKYKMERALLDKKYINHCSTPSCNRLISTYNVLSKEHTNDGHNKCTNICICQCGASICSHCKEPAHFGITCTTSKRLKKESESRRLHSEMRSLMWLQKNCTPCPKCKYPINKIGGCNHMRCGKCHNYFCWICGGDGMKCGSFRCHNARISTFGDNNPTSYLDEDNPIREQVSSIEKYTIALMQLELCEKAFVTGAKDKDQNAIHELQLRQSLAWLRARALDHLLSNGSKRNQDCIKNAAKSIELALARVNGSLDYTSMIKGEEIVTRPRTRHYSHKKSRLSKGLIQEMNVERELDENNVTLDEILEVSKFQLMDDDQFNYHVSEILNGVIKLLTDSNVKRKKEVENNTGTHKETADVLNKREKPLKASWRGESRFTAKNSPEKKREVKTVWKGKLKVTQRRNSVLSSNEFH